MLQRRAAIATLLARPAGRPVRGDRPRLDHLRPRLAGRRRPQLLSLGRDGRRRHDRARPRAGAAGPEGRGDHRRRRDADGHRQLATIGVQRPSNLAVVVFDNGAYGETGMQASHTDRVRRPVGGRARLRHRRDAGGRRPRTSWATSPAGSRPLTRRCLRACASRPTTRPACCRRGWRRAQAALPARRIGDVHLTTVVCWTGRTPAPITRAPSMARNRGLRRPGSSVGRACD